MKVSLNWLSDFLRDPASELAAPTEPTNVRARLWLDVQRVADALTAAGFEVEQMTPFARELSGLRVAEVVAVEPHPKADKLQLVRVRVGAAVSGDEVVVVCGAPNVPGPGGQVVWAMPGATLPGGVRVETRPVRGIDSPGMLVSERELGLSAEGDGIIVLSHFDRLTTGADLVSALGLDDWILEVNVTPNRGDALSHAGLARELAAALGLGFAWPETPSVACTDEGPRRGVVIEDVATCPRYQGRLVFNVTVMPAPLGMRARLAACGVRAVSNVVDVTNWVMLELGHPMHAFDDRKLRGTVRIRAAADKEGLVTLDGVERSLCAHDTVIADEQGPVAVAGVMGGARTAVDAATRDVFLEAAAFDPVRVRRTARRLGLRTESSYRFERGVDVEGVGRAAARAAALVAWFSGGAVSDGMVDRYPRRPEVRKICLPLARLERLTGLSGLATGTVKERLAALFTAEALSEQEGAVELVVPSYRRDLSMPEDLVEEYLRLIGLNAIPAAQVASNARPGLNPEAPADRIRDRLAALGFCEAATWGFVPRAHIAALDAPLEGTMPARTGELARAVVVKNPISADYEVMRTSLLPGLIEALARNLARGNDSPWLFEVGPVVAARASSESRAEALPGAPDAAPADERVVVGAVLCGRRAGWLRAEGEVDFFDAKRAALEVMALFVPIDNCRLVAGQGPPCLHPGISARIDYVGASDAGHSASRSLGWLGEVHPLVRARLGLAVPVLYLELDVAALVACAERVRPAPPPRFPAVGRDISFFVAAGVSADEQVRAMRSAAEPLLSDVAVLEDFRDPAHVPAGKKGMLWTLTYRAPDRTLTDVEVDAAHARVLAALRQALAVEIR